MTHQIRIGPIRPHGIGCRIDESNQRVELTYVQNIYWPKLLSTEYSAVDPASPRLLDIQVVGGPHIRLLEAAIDRMKSELHELSGFILPGGHISAFWSHIARTVCRRWERRVVDLQGDYPAGPGRDRMEGIVMFLNRLSDYLFVPGPPPEPAHRAGRCIVEKVFAVYTEINRRGIHQGGVRVKPG